ncbi:MAG TPA: hypothetical protein VL961_11315, partial [Acidimicrobiales bacterium]|nr:hypothetical protein [Acidimicrobiales bacterium]
DKGSPAWIGGALGFGLYMAAVAAMALTLVWVLRGRAARCRLPVLTLALLPGLFALNHMANHPGQARYVLFGSTMASLLLGVGLDRLASGRPRRDSRRPYPLGPRWRWARVWPLGLAALAALGWGALRQESPKVLVGFDAPDVPMPVDDDGLIHLLETHHIATAYANYWIAYRATFETRQATVVTPFSLDRYPPFAAMVRSSADPAYLFVARSTDVGRFVQWCEDHGVAFSRWTDAGFTVIQPVARILPSEVPRGDLH